MYVALNLVVSCGAPSFACGMSVEPFSGTTVGSGILYQCQQGFPQEGRTSVCGGDGRWSPDPATLLCEGKVHHTFWYWQINVCDVQPSTLCMQQIVEFQDLLEMELL